MEENPWREWVGKSETLEDCATPTPVRALAATLNREEETSSSPGSELQPIWNWLYFLPIVPMSNVGKDGHPERGGFLPPITLPRRMWAGSRCTFHNPIHIGDTMRRTSTITNVTEKEGKAGNLVFVTVQHEVSTESQLAVTEEQDIVYVNIPEKFTPPEPAPLPECDWNEMIPVNPVLLFRFSALTFNGHRIHYDRSYATDVENYPGLVVHGPLQAVLLFDAATKRNPSSRPASFEFRGLRPLFDFEKLSVSGQTNQDGSWSLYTSNGEGAIGMKAKITWN